MCAWAGVSVFDGRTDPDPLTPLLWAVRCCLPCPALLGKIHISCAQTWRASEGEAGNKPTAGELQQQGQELQLWLVTLAVLILGLPPEPPERVRESWFLEDTRVGVRRSQKNQGFKALYCLHVGIENHWAPSLWEKYIHNFIYICIYTHLQTYIHRLKRSAIEIYNFNFCTLKKILRETLKTNPTSSRLSGVTTNLVTLHSLYPDTKYLNVLMAGNIYFYDN